MWEECTEGRGGRVGKCHLEGVCKNVVVESRCRVAYKKVRGEIYSFLMISFDSFFAGFWGFFVFLLKIAGLNLPAA